MALALLPIISSRGRTLQHFLLVVSLLETLLAGCGGGGQFEGDPELSILPTVMLSYAVSSWHRYDDYTETHTKGHSSQSKTTCPGGWLNLDFALKSSHGRMSKPSPQARCLALTELESWLTHSLVLGDFWTKMSRSFIVTRKNAFWSVLLFFFFFFGGWWKQGYFYSFSGFMKIRQKCKFHSYCQGLSTVIFSGAEPGWYAEFGCSSLRLEPFPERCSGQWNGAGPCRAPGHKSLSVSFPSTISWLWVIAFSLSAWPSLSSSRTGSNSCQVGKGGDTEEEQSRNSSAALE